MVYVMENQEILEICADVNDIGNVVETKIAYNPVSNKDGSRDAKVWVLFGEESSTCFDVNVKTIGEGNYLEEHLPSVSFCGRTTFWDDFSNLFANAYFVHDATFTISDVYHGMWTTVRSPCYCKIENGKLYYRTYEEGEWEEIPNQPICDEDKDSLGHWKVASWIGSHKQIKWVCRRYQTELIQAVMSRKDSFFCDGVSYGVNYELRYD